MNFTRVAQVAILSAGTMVGVGCSNTPLLRTPGNEFDSPVSGTLSRLDQISDLNPTNPLANNVGVGLSFVWAGQQVTYLQFTPEGSKSDVGYVVVLDPADLKNAVNATNIRGTFDSNREIRVTGANVADDSKQIDKSCDVAGSQPSALYVPALSVIGAALAEPQQADVVDTSGNAGLKTQVFLFTVTDRTLVPNLSTGTMTVILQNPQFVTDAETLAKAKQRIENPKTEAGKTPANQAQNTEAPVTVSMNVMRGLMASSRARIA